MSAFGPTPLSVEVLYEWSRRRRRRQRRRRPREKETEIRARAEEIAGEHTSDSVFNVSKGEHRIVGERINEMSLDPWNLLLQKYVQLGTVLAMEDSPCINMLSI